MSICKIGEKKRIKGEWYQKANATNTCIGCAFAETERADSSMDCRSEGHLTYASIECGGRECSGSIWVACDPPKPAKKPAPAKWAPVELAMRGDSITRRIIKDAQDKINKLGTENARLKARLAKGGK